MPKDPRTFIWQFQRDRVAVAAGIRLSTWMVQKVDTLDGFLAGLVNPDDDFDSTNRSGRSRAAGCCREILENLHKPQFSMIFCIFLMLPPSKIKFY